MTTFYLLTDIHLTLGTLGRQITHSGCLTVPNRDYTHTQTICSDILRLVDLHKTSTIWIGGDANIPDIDWENYIITGNKYPRDINEHFIDTKSDMGLSQIINFQTREEVTLEIFLTNRPNIGSQVCRNTRHK
jgi:hypothetical protein